ncbi:TatD family hydrolase [Endozoicomonas numazuensis]|uniref:TatD family hydrolase n=1 Tax=Endozoicomonas numazuensis TaxID=1137799 RepID=UPI0009DC9FD5|nr:TatD family hydrolase [Endozoicomonas numazuensis]
MPVVSGHGFGYQVVDGFTEAYQISLGAFVVCLELLSMYPESGIPILHWLLATKKQVDRAVELGCYFSIGPAMINSVRAKKVVSWLPQNRVLLEADGPFAKTNGRPALPSDVVLVIRFLSELWGETIEQVQGRLAMTFKNLVL